MAINEVQTDLCRLLVKGIGKAVACGSGVILLGYVLPELDFPDSFTQRAAEGCIPMVILTTVTQPCYSAVTSNLQKGLYVSS